MSQSLDKIITGSLNSILESINRNFAVIENSPIFKGIPGTAGNQGYQGDVGIRGNMIFLLDMISLATNLNTANVSTDELESIMNDSAKLIILINTLGISDPDFYFLDGDMIIPTSDNQLWRVGIDTDENYTLTPTDICIGSGLSQTEIITIVDNEVSNLISGIHQIFSNYGSYTNSQTTIATTPIYVYQDHVAHNNSNSSYKYIGLSSDTLTQNIKTSTILGDIRLFDSIIAAPTNTSYWQPTSEHFPAGIIIQNDNKSGILIGGYGSNTDMASFCNIYKNADNDLNICRVFGDSTIAAQNILTIGSTKIYTEKSLDIGDTLRVSKYMRSNFLVASDENSIVQYQGKHLLSGYYNGNITNNYNPRTILSYSGSYNTIFGEHIRFAANNSDTFKDVILSTDEYGFLTNMKKYSVIYNSAYQYITDLRSSNIEPLYNVVPTEAHLQALISFLWPSAISDISDFNFDNVYIKNDYWKNDTFNISDINIMAKDTERDISKLHLSEKLAIGKKLVSSNNEYYSYELFAGNHNNQSLVTIGYNIPKNNSTNISSNTDIIIDWNNWIIAKFNTYRNVLVTGSDNNKIQSDFQWAELVTNDRVTDDVAAYSHLSTYDFDKFSGSSRWSSNLDNMTNTVTTALIRYPAIGLNYQPDDENNGKRFLTGRHYRQITHMFNGLIKNIRTIYTSISYMTSYVTNYVTNYVKQREVIPGTVIKFNPMLSDVSYSQRLDNTTPDFSHVNLSIPVSYIPYYDGVICSSPTFKPTFTTITTNIDTDILQLIPIHGQNIEHLYSNVPSYWLSHQLSTYLGVTRMTVGYLGYNHCIIMKGSAQIEHFDTIDIMKLPSVSDIQSYNTTNKHIYFLVWLNTVHTFYCYIPLYLYNIIADTTTTLANEFIS